MAKRNKETKKEKKVKEARMPFPPIAIIDNIVFSKREAWAYYKISSVPYDFLTDSGRANLANDITIAFQSLSQRAGKNTDVHILVTSTPFNVSSWEEQVFKEYDRWNGKDNRTFTLEQYMAKQHLALRQGDYKKKVTYLGVKLFTRGSITFDDVNIVDFGFAEAYEFLKKGISSVLTLPDEEITDLERNRAKRDEFEINRILRSGILRGTRLTSEELLLTIKKTLYPAMPSPYLVTNHEERIGLNDIVMETGAIIEDYRRYLKISQIVNGKEREGYRATLSFSKFPDGNLMREPHGITPFMYFPVTLGWAFVMNARLTLIPVEKMKKDLQKKKLDNEDELKNLASSGQRASSSIIDTQYEIDKLDNELNSDKGPWISGNYRMTIEMPTVELLMSTIESMKSEYARSDVILTWTSGDQLDLLLEEIPGGELKVGDFAQLTNTAMVGVAGFNYGGQVGDPIDEKTVIKRR